MSMILLPSKKVFSMQKHHNIANYNLVQIKLGFFNKMHADVVNFDDRRKTSMPSLSLTGFP